MILVLGIILGSFGSVAAYVILSSDVEYKPLNKEWKVDNVASALDDLYYKISNKGILDLLNLEAKSSTSLEYILDKRSAIINLEAGIYIIETNESHLYLRTTYQDSTSTHSDTNTSI